MEKSFLINPCTNLLNLVSTAYNISCKFNITTTEETKIIHDNSEPIDDLECVVNKNCNVYIFFSTAILDA